MARLDIYAKRGTGSASLGAGAPAISAPKPNYGFRACGSCTTTHTDGCASIRQEVIADNKIDMRRPGANAFVEELVADRLGKGPSQG